MNRLLIIIGCILLTSCYNTYHITTPEVYNCNIATTNAFIEDYGYTLIYSHIDSNLSTFYHSYVFSKFDDSVRYSLTYNYDTIQRDIYELSIVNPQIQYSARDTNICSLIKQLEYPDKVQVKLIKESVANGIIIGIPSSLLIAFIIVISI